MIKKLYKINKLKFSNNLVSALSFLIAFYVLSFKIPILIMNKIENVSNSLPVLLYYGILIIILLVFSNRISQWFNTSKQETINFENAIKITAIVMLIFLVFDFDAYSYMWHDGYNFFDFFYLTIVTIGLVALFFNKKIVKLIIEK
jgi:hypothetical protein